VVAVVGPDGAGKSKVCAALLELGLPAESRPKAASPDFAQKDRLLEWEPAEVRRNFSCYSHIYSQDRPGDGMRARLHLIDTPGHVDRAPLVERALCAAHGAVLVVSARRGVDAACGRSFAAVEREGKPAVVFLNGVDEADDMEHFDAALDALEKRLGVRPVVLFAPAHFSGKAEGSHLLNVLDGSICSALGCSLVSQVSDGKAAGELATWARKLREQQIESLAAVDDEMMEAFIEFDGEVPRIMIEAALHRAVAAGKVAPLVAGSAKSGLGVDALQEVLHSFLPANDGAQILQEMGISPVSEIGFSPRSAFLGWAFAERPGREGERLLEVRVLDGTWQQGQALKVISTDGETVKIAPSRVFSHGLRGSILSALSAGHGDLVLVPIPADMGPLGAKGALVADKEWAFERVAPSKKNSEQDAKRDHCVYALDFEGMSAKARVDLLESLREILKEDDGLRLEENTRTGETRLHFMGDLHIELVRERLAQEFKILKLPLCAAQVDYQATLRRPGKAMGTHATNGKVRMRKGIIHQSNGKQDAWAKVEISPSHRGTGISIEDPVGEVDPTRGGKVAPGASPGLERGILQGLSSAGPAGIPITDVVVQVLEAEAKDQEAVAAAAANAVKKAVDSTAFMMLEPMVHVEVDAPKEMMESVVEDLEHRHAEVWGVRPSEEGTEAVEAEVPLRELKNYPGQLKKMTRGEGFFSYQAQGYREVSLQLERQILEKELCAATPAQNH